MGRWYQPAITWPLSAIVFDSAGSEELNGDDRADLVALGATDAMVCKLAALLRKPGARRIRIDLEQRVVGLE